jgi:tetratricopeptide (TPR) repeat protein
MKHTVKKQPLDYEYLADCFLIEGNFNESIIYYQKARKLAPDNPILLNKLGVTYEKLGDVIAAERNYKLAPPKHVENTIAVKQPNNNRNALRSRHDSIPITTPSKAEVVIANLTHKNLTMTSSPAYSVVPPAALKDLLKAKIICTRWRLILKMPPSVPHVKSYYRLGRNCRLKFPPELNRAPSSA